MTALFEENVPKHVKNNMKTALGPSFFCLFVSKNGSQLLIFPWKCVILHPKTDVLAQNGLTGIHN